ncbi:regulatory protein RecX [Homoserinibacter sp. GY 40078]|uniref:regulatory protein RecX n=1 Tax=Homoserinibacter sp. GY 40078 TaxID=2603275 RepID=UPI0011C99AB2|nr:regulatory protein RecX [Homoserinibacter sp. GY 40078]TXK19831.1 regulatory protein RecX [Homoserinibacter sp. GY 40078]
MTEGTDDRLAPVTYLFGAASGPDERAVRASVPRSSVEAAGAARTDARASDSGVPVGAAAADVAPEWNDAWGSDVEIAVADLDVERISMKALGRRPLSRRELERVLRDQGVDDDAIVRESERLVRVGLLDDEALAQTLVGTLQERKGLGRSAIAAELARRMLAPSAIEYALELIDTGDELARAREVGRKRAAQLSSLDRDTAVRRLSGYLARRGYSGSTVRSVVDQLLPARGAGTAVRFR